MKTNREWYQMLPEPSRTEAIEAATAEGTIENTSLSFHDAIMSFVWHSSSSGWSYWFEIHDKAERGEFNFPWPDEAKWENAHESVIARYISPKGEVFLLVTRYLNGNIHTTHDLVATISDMSGIDWEKSLETKPK